MDPVRRVGQALDAVEVGHIVVVGLGQVFIEVAVPLAPDDQGRRLDRAQRRFGGALDVTAQQRRRAASLSGGPPSALAVAAAGA